MNLTTLVFLGLAVVWAVVLLPEVLRKLAGRRRSDSIRSFSRQLSMLDRSGGGLTGRSNVIDLRARTSSDAGAVTGTVAAAPVVPASVRKRRQEVITALAAAAVLTLLCTVAFGTAFLVLHLLADALLISYLVLVNQANHAAVRSAAPRSSLGAPAWDRTPELRTATVGRATPARRIAN